MMDYKSKSNAFEKIIKMTFKGYFYIFLFILIPTITAYLWDRSVVRVARDIGIIIGFLYTFMINVRMKIADKKRIPECEHEFYKVECRKEKFEVRECSECKELILIERDDNERKKESNKQKR